MTEDFFVVSAPDLGPGRRYDEEAAVGGNMATILGDFDDPETCHAGCALIRD